MSLIKQFRLPSLVAIISVAMATGLSDRVAALDSSFCRDIGELSQKVGQLENISANSSVGDLKEIQEEVLSAIGKITLSGAEEMGGIKIDELGENVRNLDRIMKDIDNDSTLNDIVGQVLGQVVGIVNVTKVLETVSECSSEF